MTNFTFQSYRQLKFSGKLYTWDMFSRMVGPRYLFKKLAGASACVKGLSQDADLQDLVFSQVLRNGQVTKADFIDDSKLQLCLDTDGSMLTNTLVTTVAYFFASPLHRRFVEWKLWDNYPAPSIDDILTFVIQVIRKFSPKRLATERDLPLAIPEAQYQDEFYKSDLP